MRAIVLLLLGGGLLWFVLWNSGSSRAAEEPEDTARAGYFLPVEPAPDASAPPPTADSPASPSATPDVRIEAAPRRDTLAPAPTGVPSWTAVDASTAEEIKLASEVLHRPKGLANWLARSGSNLTEARRDLVLAFAAIVAGEDTVARGLAAPLLQNPLAGTAAERALLERTVERAEERAIVASVLRDTPLMSAATMGLLARRGRAGLEAGHDHEAAGIFSELLVGELRASWKAESALLQDWSDCLNRAQAGHQWNRKGGWPSIEVTVEKGDSLISIRKRVLQTHPEVLLCTGQIERANQLRGAAIQPGQVLRIPTDRAHVLVDVDAHWVLYFLGDLVAGAWEAGVGKPGSETQPGTYTVGDKNTEPMWFPSGKAPIPYGDPENPLGTRWIGWVGSDGRNSGLAFHGTRDPESIGQDQSQGCVRMLNRDVEALYEILPKGATIVVQA